MTDSLPSFEKHFADISDPRVTGRCQHKLFDILFIAVTAFISRCDDWEMVALWAREREPWLRKFCELPNGIPSHDTFTRVFARINPEALRIAFVGWMKEIQELTAGHVVAVDGKTLRRAFAQAGDGQGAVHMVSAWAAENRVVLGQCKVESKSNEITAIPELLKLLEIKGDIREYYQGTDRSKLRAAPEWAGLRSMGMVVSHRLAGPGQNSTETRYYISSLPAGVKRMAKGVRSHWGIENQLHYVLDMSFDEDRNRTRAGDGAENMATIRHVAMNFLQAAKYLKVGIKNRRNLAAISTEILEKILVLQP